MTSVMTPRIWPRLGPVSMSSGWIVVVASEVDSSSPTSLLGILCFNKTYTMVLKYADSNLKSKMSEKNVKFSQIYEQLVKSYLV